jgi:hypothetical protein
VEPGAFLPSKERKASEERRRKSYLVPTEAYSYQTLTPGATAKHLKAFPVTVDPQRNTRALIATTKARSSSPYWTGTWR